MRVNLFLLILVVSVRGIQASQHSPHYVIPPEVLEILSYALAFTLREKASQVQPHVQPQAASRFPCTVPGCARAYTRPCSRKTHIKTYHMGLRYICPHEGCNQTRTTQYALRKHVRNDHQGRRRAWTCPYCGTSIAEGKNKGRHFKTKKCSYARMNSQSTAVQAALLPSAHDHPLLQMESRSS